MLHPAEAQKNIWVFISHISLINALPDPSRLRISASKSHDRLTSVEIALHFEPVGLSGSSLQIKHPPTVSFSNFCFFHPSFKKKKKTWMQTKQKRKQKAPLQYLSLSSHSVKRRCRGRSRGFWEKLGPFSARI